MFRHANRECRLLAAAVLSLAGFPAQGRTVNEVATYLGADRRAQLEAGAKLEGELQIYTTGTQSDPVYAAFMKAYPYVRVMAFKANVPDVTRKFFEEARAGTYLADSIDLSTGGLYVMKEAQLLQSYKTPAFDHIRKDVIEPEGYWAIGYESYISFGYNTDLLAKADVPKTLDDLLAPRFSARMALPNGSTLVNWIGALMQEKDEAWLKRLAGQKTRIFEVSARAVANLVVSGEVAMSPAMYNSHFANSADQGAHVAWTPLGGVNAFVGAFALAANAPHPNAAMLYIDFALSSEGQKVFQKLGYASTRTDLENREKPSKIYYLTDRPSYTQDYERWEVLSRQFTDARP